MVMHFGRNNKKSPLYINEQKLNITESESDLGVIFSSNLKWKNHVIKCVGKANQMLGWIRKCFVCLDIRLLRILYVSFVRPLLEFAVQVWSPNRKGQIELLERVQHRATRLIVACDQSIFKNIPHQYFSICFGLPPKRSFLALCEVFRTS